MKRIMLILVIMLPLLLVAQSRGEYECQQLSRIAFEKLDLTEIQKEKLHQIRIESKKKIIQMSADLKLAKIELHELMSKDIMSKKLDATIDKVADLKRKMFKAKIKTKVEMKKILTTEQRAKMKELCRKQVHQGRGCHDKSCDKSDGKRHPHYRMRPKMNQRSNWR